MTSNIGKSTIRIHLFDFHHHQPTTKTSKMWEKYIYLELRAHTTLWIEVKVLKYHNIQIYIIIAPNEIRMSCEMTATKLLHFCKRNFIMHNSYYDAYNKNNNKLGWCFYFTVCLFYFDELCSISFHSALTFFHLYFLLGEACASSTLHSIRKSIFIFQPTRKILAPEYSRI